MLAIAADASAQHAHPIVVRVTGDAGLRIGRDVGRIEHAERQLKGAPAGERLAARRGVAGFAIGGAGEVLAARDQIRLAHRHGRQAGRCRAAGHRGEQAVQGRHAHATSWPLPKGSRRSRLPVAAKIALPKAGAAAAVPVSPMPPGASSLRI